MSLPINYRIRYSRRNMFQHFNFQQLLNIQIENLRSLIWNPVNHAKRYRRTKSLDIRCVWFVWNIKNSNKFTGLYTSFGHLIRPSLNLLEFIIINAFRNIIVYIWFTADNFLRNDWSEERCLYVAYTKNILFLSRIDT